VVGGGGGHGWEGMGVCGGVLGMWLWRRGWIDGGVGALVLDVAVSVMKEGLGKMWKRQEC
jgi:hypothetical protein